MNARTAWVVAGAGCLLFLLALGARDLWNPSEPIYGLAVAELAARDGWIMPTVNGIDFAEKPPLYFWLARVAALAGGDVDELVLRLPQALSGILGLVLLYGWLVRRGSRAQALTGCGLFATLFMVWWGARSVQMDFLITVSTLAAVRFATEALDGDRPSRGGWGWSGLAAGLGFLAKGPVALLLPLAIVVGYRLSGPRPRPVRARELGWAAGSFAVCVLPWLAGLFAAGRVDALQEMLLRQNLTRFTSAWDHQQPFWYYGLYFWIDMAPWAWFVPLAVRLPGRTGDERRSERLAWIWIAVVLALFSMSASKRSAYILPLAPAVALLVAPLFERLRRGLLEPWRRRATLGVIGAQLVLLAAAAVLFWLRAVPRYPDSAAIVKLTAAAIALGAVAVLAAAVGKARTTAVAWIGAVAGIYLFAGTVTLPEADRYKSPRAFCEQVRDRAGYAPLASYRFWRWRAEYAFYSGRPIDNLDDAGELERFWTGEGPGWLLVRQVRLQEARGVIGDVEPVLTAAVGSKTVHLFDRLSGDTPATAE